MGTFLINDALKKAPITPVNAIIIKIVNDIFLFLIACIVAIRAPNVSTSILVLKIQSH